MIELSIQIKLIVFSFVFGFAFSFILEILNKNIKKFSKTIKIIFSFILIAFASFVYFVGIQKIGNAIFHIYSIVNIILGFISYDIIIKVIANNSKRWYTLYGDYMAKRRISRASKRRLTFFGTISFIAIVYFCFSLIYNLYTIYELRIEKRNLEKLYVNLKEESENLKTDIEKLNDSTYLANYARENYLYSKDGEYILQLDDIEKVEDDIDRDINKNYIIVGLSAVMVFIFMYIVLKGRKKRN